MLEEKAKKKRCPRRVDEYGDFEFCYGLQCMSWVQYNKGDIGECGHCAWLYGE